MPYTATHISISVNRQPPEVYAYAANPNNLSQWAAGLSRAEIKRAGEWWIADGPMGQVKIRFAGENAFGVMDHDVMLPDGTVNHNPFRVVANDQGSEVIFTLFRLPQTSAEAFAADAAMIRADLERLKALLEK